MFVMKCGGCSFRLEKAKVSKRPVSINVDAKTPLVIFASYVDVFASLTHVSNPMTLPLRSKLMMTMTKEMDPPNAAP